MDQYSIVIVYICFIIIAIIGVVFEINYHSWLIQENLKKPVYSPGCRHVDILISERTENGRMCKHCKHIHIDTDAIMWSYNDCYEIIKDHGV